MRCVVVTVCAIAQLFVISHVFAGEVRRPVNRDLAEHLAAQGADYSVRGMVYDRREGQFFVIEQTGLIGDAVGWIAVNRWTGDVWDAWACKRLSTPSLRRSQAKIRARFGGTQARYAKLNTLKPLCWGP
jgi:hypothetical protein